MLKISLANTTNCHVPQKEEVSMANKEIVVHQGVIGLQNVSYRMRIGSRVSEDPFADSVGATYAHNQHSTHTTVQKLWYGDESLLTDD
jgi:hypothetical protein